ncbi:hypothetical protein [Leisingera sp. ANG-M7]|uniref:hypothetical protein n=1 Tax=Leisingera sp. ANG-M7 TaxID=1577902 RepID=UPI001269EAD4|nr:hypothetical protein [Leisingera sp. ANG-M7]
MNEVYDLIKLVTPEIQKLVDAKFTEFDGVPPTGSSLDQVNLLGGNRIVYDYLEHGELRVAFEHLEYMIDETGISLDASSRSKIRKIAHMLS